MDIDELKENNEDKAEAEFERGPTRDDAAAAPIGEAIGAFYERGDLAFGIPAHRGGTGRIRADAAQWTGDEAYRADLGMSNGVDNRHQSWRVEPTAMQLFARAVGADTTLFSTGGSSQNVHVAMMAAVKPGETIAMARNGHKSSFAGLVLAGAWPVYVDPVYDGERHLAHGVTPEEMERVLREHPEARAAMIFTPTYYGVSASVSGIADVVHRHGIPLLTDDAWGLDYSFSSQLPPSSMESGADLAIGSVHKTLSGLGQTSVMSVQGDRIDTERLQIIFELEQSTSASAILLASIDAARRQFQRDGEELIGQAIGLARRARDEIVAIDGLSVMGEEVLGPGAEALDPTHLTVEVGGLGITGFSAADWLREHRGIHVELADYRRVMLLISYADDDANINRLISALRDLSEHRDEADHIEPLQIPTPAELRTETVMLPRDAYLGATEMVEWRKAAGRVSAEMVCPYPPGIPIVAPGELLTQEIVEYLQQVVAAGAMVEGAVDESLAQMRVAAR
jgi:arginine decarboxylase